MKKDKLVLVTGASGFIAIHCIIQLLEQGYQVRGTLRSLDREIFVDTSRIRKTLNWQPRSLEEMLVSTAESMIELKMV